MEFVLSLKLRVGQSHSLREAKPKPKNDRFGAFPDEAGAGMYQFKLCASNKASSPINSERHENDGPSA